MKCYNCGGEMKKDVELIIHKGKTFPQNVSKCTKCGESIVSANEYERIRKEIHPNLFNRIKGLFSCNTESVDLFKGKIL